MKRVTKSSKTLPNSEKSEKLKQAQADYDEAKFIHDRFCKFEAPFLAPQDIRTIKLISQTIPISTLRIVDLSFKLNNLRWFLTPDGLKFLEKQKIRAVLDKKLDDLYKKQQVAQKTPTSEIPQNSDSALAKDATSGYILPKFGEDVEIKESEPNLLSFVSNN